MPMMPPAPPRLSTMNCWPSASDSFCENCRAVMSLPPPGAKGTITRTTFVGYCSLQTGAAAVTRAQAATEASAVKRVRADFIYPPTDLRCGAGVRLLPEEHSMQLERVRRSRVRYITLEEACRLTYARYARLRLREHEREGASLILFAAKTDASSEHFGQFLTQMQTHTCSFVRSDFAAVPYRALAALHRRRALRTQ